MSDDKANAEAEAFLRSQEMDKIENYSARGRAHQRVPQDELGKLWIAAFRTMVENPTDVEARRREQDLSSEFRLRGGGPPYAEVKDLVDRFCSSAIERLEQDPEAMERVRDSLEADFAEFWSQRKRKN